MKNQKINSIALLAIFLVIAIPTVYGAVEPSMIINMESGQTEKPIQVKDSGGTIVFSVDTDGSVFSAGFGTEQTILDNSGFTGSSDIPIEDGFIQEFTLPTTASLWRVTAIEVFVGDKEGDDSGNKICAIIINPHSSLSSVNSPPETDDTGTGTIVEIGKNNHAIPDDTATGNGNLDNNTIYRVEFGGSYLASAGEVLWVVFDACQGASSSAMEFIGSGTGDSTTQATSYTIVDNEFPNNLIGSRHGNAVDFELGNVNTQLYLKVYAQPLG